MKKKHLLLAQLLPELIYHHLGYDQIVWRNNSHLVLLDRDWEFVCHQAEARLTEQQLIEYTEYLLDEVGADRAHLDAVSTTTWQLRVAELSKLAKATAEHRIVALCKTLWPDHQ